MSGMTTPLWQVMHKAYWQEGAGFDSGRIPPAARECFAAEIRALADWLVPVEAPKGEKFSPLWREWAQRYTLRRRLLAEADRAEVGD